MIRLFFTFTDNAVAVSKQDGIPYIIKTFFHYHICDKFKGGLKHLEILFIRYFGYAILVIHV